MWTIEMISSSPRFHFSTENIFEFGRIYDVILTSLPRSNSSQQSVIKHVTMPRHPELNKTLSDPSFDCSKYCKFLFCCISYISAMQITLEMDLHNT
uniref:Protein kinase domain-containing protein n=1 Tax=Ascaris lumbricoides TaxID=6252 RepID=A0A0M3ITQ8_ASCLU